MSLFEQTDLNDVEEPHDQGYHAKSEVQPANCQIDLRLERTRNVTNLLLLKGGIISRKDLRSRCDDRALNRRPTGISDCCNGGLLDCCDVLCE